MVNAVVLVATVLGAATAIVAFVMLAMEMHAWGDVGWAKRPPAVVRCPSCSSSFTHEFANDYIDCPHCHFERPPDDFDELDLIGLVCPYCENKLEEGVRQPGLVDAQ